MPLNAQVQIQQDDRKFKVGTAGYTLLDYTLTFNGHTDIQATFGDCPETVTNGIEAYLNEAWQVTAGKMLALDVNPPLQVSGHSQVNFITDQIIQGRFRIANAGNPKRITPGIVDIYQLGYCQFAWGSGSGKLIPINFLDQAVFPEAPGPTGLHYFLRPGVTGTLVTRTKPLQLCPIFTSGGRELGMLEDVVTGANGSFSGGDPVPIASSWATRYPTIGAHTTVNTSHSSNWGGTQGFNTNLTESQKYKVMLAWAAEIWESLIVKEQGFQTSPYGTITGSNQKIYSTSLMRSAIVQVNNTVDLADWQYGVDSVKYYGIVAPIYPFGYGEIVYLNTNRSFIIPQQIPCVGLAWWLKPGVTATLTTTTTVGITTGITTPTGRVCLADGAVAGLVL
jgi:hypothetical protein